MRKGKPLPGLAALAAALLCGCASQGPDAWTRAAAESGRDVEAQWARYHWYIPAMSHEVRARWVSENGYSGPSVVVTMRMAAKALTPEGAAFVGALHLEGWKDEIASLSVTHLDSAGRAVPVPMDKVREGFHRNGVIVVPRVAKGSTVSVRLTQGPFSAINHWEMAMDAAVPVLRNEFRLTSPKIIALTARAYNGLQGPEVQSNGRFNSPTQIWTAEKVMPFADLPYADGMTARPRLVLINRGNSWGTRYPDWAAVAREARRTEYDRGWFDSKGKTRELASKLAQGGDEPAQARRLLEWAQDNFAVTDGKTKRMGLDAMLEQRRGTAAQVAQVFAGMCEAVGLKARIVLTRPREWGGLDPETPNPNAAQVPIVLVHAGSRDWAAFPQSSAFALGDYPTALTGLQALSLDGDSLVPLPAPAHPVSRLESRQDVPLDRSPTRQAEVELSGPWAADLRSRWTEALGRDPQEACRKEFRRLGFEGRILTCKAQDLEDRESPLRLSLTLDNGSTYVEDGASASWSFPELFFRPAWFYDSSRTEAYWFPSDQVRRETVRFTGAAGKKPQPSIACHPFEDSLLKVTCLPTADGTGFTRETVLRKGSYPASALRSRSAVLAELGRTRDTRVIAR
jgi:transglutaminase-like putative cysteine protease